MRWFDAPSIFGRAASTKGQITDTSIITTTNASTGNRGPTMITRPDTSNAPTMVAANPSTPLRNCSTMAMSHATMSTPFEAPATNATLRPTIPLVKNRLAAMVRTIAAPLIITIGEEIRLPGHRITASTPKATSRDPALTR